MASIDKINLLREKEKEMRSIFEDMKTEKKEEIVEQIKKHLMENETEQARIVIEKLEELKEFNLETNINLLSNLEDAFNLKPVEINYEQLKMDNERKEEKKEIDNIFMNQLQKRGYTLEEETGNIKKITRGEQTLYFFEVNEITNVIEDIEKNMKYQSLLIGTQTMEKEEKVVNIINEWIKNTVKTPEQKETYKKYVSLNVTSKERLNKDLESMKKIKIA
jgi:hypothetical protein